MSDDGESSVTREKFCLKYGLFEEGERRNRVRVYFAPAGGAEQRPVECRARS
jgi:hypothetical protein